jgi:phenylacetate-CoA ligase
MACKLLNKIGLGLETYWQAWSAITRQFEPEKITRIQNTKLQSLLRYCFNNIKYYREAFEQTGISPEQIKTAEDLHKIPILTKEQLRERFWDFLPHELPACRVSRTSGSTGVPVCILSDKNSRVFNSAAVIRYRQALGIGFVGKAILTPLKTTNEPYRKKPHWTYLQGIHKTYYVNPYIDSQDNIEYAGKLLNKLKKPALIGITTAVRTLAYKVRDGFFPSFRPGAILTTGEILSSEVRSLLETTFGTKVADIYACNESGDIAWQCRYSNGYHINADNVIVEIVKGDEPAADGQTGEVVITNLNRYSMPIIRYKNGDLARLTEQPCPCGCKLPVIAEIVGRTGEDIFLPDGKTVPWNQLKSLMNHPQVRQFQLVQNIDGILKIKYVAESKADISVLEQLLSYRFRNLLGNSISIATEQVSRIDPAPSGKSKLVICQYKRV